MFTTKSMIILKKEEEFLKERALKIDIALVSVVNFMLAVEECDQELGVAFAIVLQEKISYQKFRFA